MRRIKNKDYPDTKSFSIPLKKIKENKIKRERENKGAGAEFVYGTYITKLLKTRDVKMEIKKRTRKFLSFFLSDGELKRDANNMGVVLRYL